MNDTQYIESENIKCYGVYSNYSNRRKSATITKEDIEKLNYINDTAQDLINEVDLMEELE